MKTAFIFIPDILQLNEVGSVEGFSKEVDDYIAFYITNSNLVAHSAKSIGYCSEVVPRKCSLLNEYNEKEWLHINLNDDSINIVNQKESYQIICIKYDFLTFTKSEIQAYKTDDYGIHFETLSSAIKTEKPMNKVEHNILVITLLAVLNLTILLLNLLEKFVKLFSFFKYSETALYLENNVNILQSTLLQIKLKHKINLQSGNILVARVLDVFLGILVLYYALAFEDEIISFVENSAEKFVQGVKQLLIFLMGSPIGLKLNYAFNKTLGSFFLYHLSLWRAFLISMRPFLHSIFHLLIIPGSLGLTFQVALIEDFVRFSTLHVYCIYVYAARLYRVQVVGLGSLWPLFMGKKYNPLRNRIDSHQYSHHQLFIGTLGFTILLFLWPTTFLYYSIFITLRVGLIILGKILVYIRQLLQYLPAYVILLWLFNSPTLAGNIRLKIEQNRSEPYLTLQASLLKVSLKETLSLILPKTPLRNSPITWSTLIKNIFNAVLL